MKTYGYGSHDAKVEKYPAYKKKRFEARKAELNQILTHIRLCSLTEDDKEKLLRELADEINLVIYKKLIV